MSERSVGPVQGGATQGRCAEQTVLPVLQVLYVEDDRITAMLFAAALRAEPDMVVEVAESAAEALALVQSWQPDLLVLDAHLPGLDGFGLLAQLRARPGLADVPACMCSADSDPALRARAVAAGFQGFWVKPVAGPALASLVRGFVADNRPR